MAKWIIEESEIIDDWKHHKCSNCGVLAPFDYVMEEDWDEGIDGEWHSLGLIQTGIKECISKFCPICGASMDYNEVLHEYSKVYFNYQ